MTVAKELPSEASAIRLAHVGKMYKVFPSRLDNFLDAIGVSGLMSWRESRFSEFWALRGVNLELRRGARLGIIGPNGAGKTTLLRLIAGALSPTEGTVEVSGRVQALFHAGTVFHPEFTGYENVRAALTYQDLSSSQITAATKDIAEFTELGGFLDQPFKNYSAGMQARLAFATATVVRPEVLIVDEVLGVGDAYFFRKSSERMRDLMDRGTTLLLVSHALDQVMMLCDRAIWLDRGTIVHDGPSTSVTKAYMRHMDTLSDRRLRAKNRSRKYAGFSPAEEGTYAEALVVELRVSGPPGASCDLAEVTAWEGGEVYERLLIGYPQDATTSQVAFVILDASDWGNPRRTSDTFFRSIAASPQKPTAVGAAVFNFYAIHDDEEYGIELNYRRADDARVTLAVTRDGERVAEADLMGESGAWITERLSLNIRARSLAPRSQAVSAGAHWPGEGSILITSASLVDDDGTERTRFAVDAPMTILVRAESRREGDFPVTPAITLFRSDGLLVSNHVGEERVLQLQADEPLEYRLRFPSLNLGNGTYLLSVGLFREITPGGQSRAYDLIGLSYEFEVSGRGPLDNGVFRHPTVWQFAQGRVSSAKL